MNRISYFKLMVTSYQELNLEEGHITFAEEGFTQLYETAWEAFKEYDGKVKSATVKGILIGAVGTGVGCGIFKLGKTIKDNRELEVKEEV